MGDRFIGWLEKTGHDIESASVRSLPYIATAGEATVTLFLPSAAPAINSTINTIIATEQKYTALGRQTGSGEEKLADVIGITGPAIEKLLQTAGKPNTSADVANVVNSLVTIMNLTPTASTKA
jgi:hypothetical protein